MSWWERMHGDRKWPREALFQDAEFSSDFETAKDAL